MMIDELEQIKRLDNYKTELRDRAVRQIVYSCSISAEDRDLLERYIECVGKADLLKNSLIQELKLKSSRKSMSEEEETKIIKKKERISYHQEQAREIIADLKKDVFHLKQLLAFHERKLTKSINRLD